MSTAPQRPDFREIFDYESRRKFAQDECNLCGRKSAEPDYRFDRFGYLVGVVQCPDCGLVYISPRMSEEGYAKFYDGPYRALVSAWTGQVINAETMAPKQLRYAKSVSKFLDPFVKPEHFSLLDVGGSTGIVGTVVRFKFKLNVTVIDPCAEELAVAKKAGMNTILGTIEKTSLQGRQFAVILLCQTVDHLLDIKGTLKKLHGAMAKN